MDSLTTFGNIIRLQTDEYVFLAEMGSSTYLAKIVKPPQSMALFRLMERRELQSVSGSVQAQQKLERSPLYNFVELTTEEFNNCLALLYGIDRNTSEIENFINLQKLNTQDIQNLKEAILASDGVPGQLKEHVLKLS